MEGNHIPVALRVEVTNVYDGDTVAVRSRNVMIEWLPGGSVLWSGTVRLFGIDAPETMQRDGSEA